MGRTVAAIGAHDTLVEAFHLPAEFLIRPKHGEWDDLSEEDIRENERALLVGSRLLAADTTRSDEGAWVIAG